MNEKELDEIAGEYVLGTLSRKEWVEAFKLVETNPHFASLVNDWEQRLAPLEVSNDAVAPPLGSWHMLAERLEQHQKLQAELKSLDDVSLADDGFEEPFPLNDNVIAMKRSRNRWRGLALGAMALAAGFIGLQAAGIYLPYLPRPAAEGRFVAVLNPDGATPGFVIRVDVGAKRLDIERLVNEAPSGKDYELWLIEPEQKPKSLHVVGRDKVQRVSYAEADDQTPVTFAITLEPEGGSPTGSATGPIVFSGQLILQ